MNHTPLSHHGGLGIFDKEGNLYASVSRYHEANRDAIIRACNAYPALVAACRAGAKYSNALLSLQEQSPSIMGTLVESVDLDKLFADWHDKTHGALGALAAAGADKPEDYGIDPEYEARLADVGLHGENAQAMSHPLPLLDGTIREEA